MSVRRHRGGLPKVGRGEETLQQFGDCQTRRLGGEGEPADTEFVNQLLSSLFGKFTAAVDREGALDTPSVHGVEGDDHSNLPDARDRSRRASGGEGPRRDAVPARPVAGARTEPPVSVPSANAAKSAATAAAEPLLEHETSRAVL